MIVNNDIQIRKRKYMIDKKEERCERTIISKHFHKYMEACCKELGFESDEHMGYFFYISTALSVSCLKKTGMSIHSVGEILSKIVETAYLESDED